MTFQPSSRLWFLVPLGALVFVLWVNHAAVQRIDTLGSVGDPIVEVDQASPTGYSHGTRNLLVRNHDPLSYHWLLQTHHTLAGEWRVRRVEYDNPPQGREVRTPSPYRWWLGVIASGAAALRGGKATQALDAAALYADPLLHALFLVLSSLLVRRWFGMGSAVIHSVGVAALVPLAQVFLAGAPSDLGLALVGAWFAIVPLTVRPGTASPASAGLRRAFCAGLAGGFTIWVSAAVGVAVLGALTFAGVVLAFVKTEDPRSGRVGPWIHWGLGGAVSVLLFFLIEYFPDHLATWQLEYVHPLWGLAWLGCGGLVHALAGGSSLRRRILYGIGAVLAIAPAVVVLLRTPSRAVLTAPLTLRVPVVPGSIGAETTFSWLGRAGLNGTVVAALGALIGILCVAGWTLFKARRTAGTHGAAGAAGLALSLFVVLALLGLTLWQVHWWTLLAIGLVGLAATSLANGLHPAPHAQESKRAGGQRVAAASGFPVVAAAILLVSCVPSVFAGIAHAAAKRRETAFSEADIAGLVGRDIAHWLARRAGNASPVVLAPPGTNLSLCFHGGVRGLGALSWENREGFEGAIRIAGATSPDEGLALGQNRNLTHIVLPSWDKSLDTLVQANAPASSVPLITTLHAWQSPRWLRPVAYPMPTIPGFEAHSVKIFEVVEVQDHPLALARLAEFFLEKQMLQEAVAVAITLEQTFPNELHALVARVIVAKGIRDSEGLNSASTALVRLVSAPLDPMPWDRQVALVIALAEIQRFDLARTQLEQCLATIDEPELRRLSSRSLFRLLLLCKLNRQEISDLRLRKLALQLLPPEMRSRIQ